MMDIVTLAKLFERKQHHICCNASPPTNESINKIEDHLRFNIPEILIAFAQSSNLYGNWLASIGEDYDSDTHIISINDEWHNAHVKEARVPANFIIFNLGYDEDFDCFDIETYDQDSDEYLITYWYPGIDLRESSLYGSFSDYMSAQILGWSYT